MYFGFVTLAFVLGLWAGVGWSKRELLDLRNEHDELRESHARLLDRAEEVEVASARVMAKSEQLLKSVIDQYPQFDPDQNKPAVH